ncbi:MAG: 50S ribosomal protein L9 [Pseudomonadota bacterium]
MDIILLKKVVNLGTIGDKVQVKPGYGRNFLIPTGQAVSATAANLKVFEARRAGLERDAAESLATAKVRKEQLEGLTVTILARSGEEGRLFGSIGTTDIARAIQAAGVAIEKQVIRLPKGPLRQLGHHEVELRLHPEVNARLPLEIIPEG